MKSLKFLLLVLAALSAKIIMASEIQVSLDEYEVKEEAARKLGLNAQQIEVFPSSIEYDKKELSGSEGVNLKGKFFITWSVRELTSTDEKMTYTKSGVTYSSNSQSLDGAKEGNLNNSVRIGYQFFENLGAEATYEESSSTMELTDIGSGKNLGKVASTAPMKIQNDFQSIKVSLVTNANVIDAKSWRMDLVAGANGGLMTVDSTYKNSGDVYSDAIGYSYGGEVSGRIIHKSGLYLQAGVGVNNKVLSPKTHEDGSQSEFTGKENYVFVNIGLSFGGKKRR